MTSVHDQSWHIHNHILPDNVAQSHAFGSDKHHGKRCSFVGDYIDAGDIFVVSANGLVGTKDEAEMLAKRPLYALNTVGVNILNAHWVDKAHKNTLPKKGIVSRKISSGTIRKFAYGFAGNNSGAATLFKTACLFLALIAAVQFIGEGW